MAKILVIDDEKEILKLIENALRTEHDTVCRESFSEAEMSALTRYDLIILDVMMPDEDGFAVCARIRDLVDCPILFLTAKSTDEDVAYGLSIGADDYIRKPFSVTELRARVNAHLRRERREKSNALERSGVRF
ncbi:MAG: response regulator transcription factor, partial [Lachnospiraceae bacterium]|nr:response regulator transcription factor [Lachnospiraceae bacterium]